MTARDLLTPAERAEQTGAAIALAMLDDLMCVDNDPDAMRVIQSAVLDLAELPRRDAAAGGAAAVLADVLMRGVRAGDTK
jgi:hypothetical protein